MSRRIESIADAPHSYHVTRDAIDSIWANLEEVWKPMRDQ